MSDKRPPHDAGASSPHLRNFPLRVSGASSTMSDMHPPHVYGSSSPHRRNIITHFETSPQHVYGASSLHLRNFFPRVSGIHIYIYIYIYGCSTVFGPLVFWYVPLQIQALVFTGLGRRHLSPDVFITSQWQQRSSCDPLRAAYIPKQKDTKT